MPNYNYAQYIAEALDSVVNQTFQDIELILIDDASTDNSIEIIKPYLDKYPFIHFIKNKQNLGFFKSIQIGLDCSQGEYIAFPSSDDILFPNFLEKKVNMLDQYPDIGLCFSDYAFFSQNQPDQVNSTFINPHLKEMKLSPADLIQQVKMYRLWIPGNATLSRKKLFIQHGGYDPKYQSLTDWFVFLKIGFQHGAYFFHEKLAAMRTHPNSLSQTESSNTKEIAWTNMIKNLSDKKNRTLKKAFIRSHVFNTQGYKFFDFILKNPRYWLFFKQYTYKHFYKRWRKEKNSAHT